MDVQELVLRLWRRRWLVAAILALGSLLGLLFASSQTPRYRSNASLLIGPRSTSAQDITQALGELAFSRELLQSYLLLFEGRSMSERLVERLQLPVSPRDLQGRIDARLLPETRVIEVEVVDPDPQLAADIANETIEVFQVEFHSAIGGDTVSATPITVASPDTSPVAPRPLRTGILAFLLTGFAVVAFTLVRERFDVTLRSSEDLGTLPWLATIPEVRSRRWRPGLSAVADDRSRSAEAFRMLRASVEFRLPEGPAIVLVTSPSEGEGKSTIALNLARTYASAGRKVALIDMDLRKPVLHTRLGLPQEPGLADLVANGAHVEHEMDGMVVVTAGRTVAQTSESFLSHQVEEILRGFKDRADVTIVDSPPVSVVDPLLIARHVQGVVLVARAGRSTRRDVERAAQRLNESGGNLLGVALNGARARDAGYGAGYGYGYGYGYGEAEGVEASARRDSEVER